MKVLTDYVAPTASSIYAADVAELAKLELGTIAEFDGIPVEDAAKHKSYIQAEFTKAGLGARFQEFAPLAYADSDSIEFDGTIEPTGSWIVKTAEKRPGNAGPRS